MADSLMDIPRLAIRHLSSGADRDVAARNRPNAGLTGEGLSLLLASPVRLRKEATRGPADPRGLDRARTAYIRMTC